VWESRSDRVRIRGWRGRRNVFSSSSALPFTRSSSRFSVVGRREAVGRPSVGRLRGGGSCGRKARLAVKHNGNKSLHLRRIQSRQFQVRYQCPKPPVTERDPCAKRRRYGALRRTPQNRHRRPYPRLHRKRTLVAAYPRAESTKSPPTGMPVPPSSPSPATLHHISLVATG